MQLIECLIRARLAVALTLLQPALRRVSVAWNHAAALSDSGFGLERIKNQAVMFPMFPTCIVGLLAKS